MSIILCHKAIKRLPDFEEAMRILAEMRSGSPITAIVDATIFTLSCYDERMVRLKRDKSEGYNEIKCPLGR